MSSIPNIARKGPFRIEVEAGKTCTWCACGRSSNQPFRDGSHKETAFTPVVYKPGKSGTGYLCGCRHAGGAPFCDGTHWSLSP